MGTHGPQTIVDGRANEGGEYVTEMALKTAALYMQTPKHPPHTMTTTTPKHNEKKRTEPTCHGSMLLRWLCFLIVGCASVLVPVGTKFLVP